MHIYIQVISRNQAHGSLRAACIDLESNLAMRAIEYLNANDGPYAVTHDLRSIYHRLFVE